MRRHIALAIHNDPKIVRNLKDTFASLDHEYVWVRSQQEARALLAENDYCCIFVDLEIPACSRGGMPSIDNGLNLVEQIRAIDRLRNVPIVAAVRLCEARPRLVARAMRLGTTDFIEKPFPTTGDTLCRVLKKALDYAHTLWHKVPAANPTPSPEPVLFKGGEMTFYPDHVELCGAKVLGDTGAGQTRRILEELARGGEKGQFVARGGASLARAVEAAGGQNAVAGYVRNFRKGVVRAFTERGITCGLQDVILSGGQGYRLRDWITVRHVGQAAAALAETGR
jgi:CheY-like chemotaxis protein